MREPQFLELDQYEDLLIEKFAKNAFFTQLPTIEWAVLYKVLLQRRFISHCFTPIYDLIVDGLDQEEYKSIVRRLIREEYPDKLGSTPSHRELLIHDLKLLGLDQGSILKSRPSVYTLEIIDRTFQLVYHIYNEENRDLRNLGLLLMVRFWGEILVAAEYNCLWAKLCERIEPSQSKFYYDHYSHDKKTKKIMKGQSSKQGSHSDSTIQFITECVNNVEGEEYFKQMENVIYTLKTDFYAQFVVGKE